MLPPSRPVSNSSSTESTLTRELSRHDLSVDPGAGGAPGSGSGNGMNGHHSHLSHPPQQQQQHHQQQNSSQRGVDALTFSKVCPATTSDIVCLTSRQLNTYVDAAVMHWQLRQARKACSSLSRCSSRRQCSTSPAG